MSIPLEWLNEAPRSSANSSRDSISSRSNEISVEGRLTTLAFELELEDESEEEDCSTTEEIELFGGDAIMDDKLQ